MQNLSTTTCDLLLDACIAFEKTVADAFKGEPGEACNFSVDNLKLVKKIQAIDKFKGTVSNIKVMLRSEFARDENYNFPVTAKWQF